MGFDKLSMLSGPNYQIRIHIWWPKLDKTLIREEGIHNHKFNFASHILLGGILNDIYDRCNNEDHGAIVRYEYVACPVDVRSYDRFQYVGQSTLHIVNSISLYGGDIYDMTHEQYHSTIPINNNTDITATLFIRTQDIKSRDTIFEETEFHNFSDMGNVRNIPLSQEEYFQRINQLLQHL